MAVGREQIREKVFEIIAKQISLPDDQVDERSTMEELGADSLDVVEVIMKLEDVFSIEIADRDADKFKTIADIVDYVHRSHKE